MNERYVKGPELALLMGVSERTINRWVAAGMPSETWGMRARRFLPSRAMEWASGRPTTLGDDNRPASVATAAGHDTRGRHG